MNSNVWMLWNRAMSDAILCPVVCVSNITNKAAVCGKRIKSLRFLRERKGCSSGGIYVPCIYTHARWALLQVTWSLLLYLHYLFWWLINSLVCWFYPFLLFISTEQTNMAGPWGAQIQSSPPPKKREGEVLFFGVLAALPNEACKWTVHTCFCVFRPTCIFTSVLLHGLSCPRSSKTPSFSAFPNWQELCLSPFCLPSSCIFLRRSDACHDYLWFGNFCFAPHIRQGMTDSGVSLHVWNIRSKAQSP